MHLCPVFGMDASPTNSAAIIRLSSFAITIESTLRLESMKAALLFYCACVGKSLADLVKMIDHRKPTSQWMSLPFIITVIRNIVHIAGFE